MSDDDSSGIVEHNRLFTSGKICNFQETYSSHTASGPHVCAVSFFVADERGEPVGDAIVGRASSARRRETARSGAFAAAIQAYHARLKKNEKQIDWRHGNKGRGRGFGVSSSSSSSSRSLPSHGRTPSLRTQQTLVDGNEEEEDDSSSSVEHTSGIQTTLLGSPGAHRSPNSVREERLDDDALCNIIMNYLMDHPGKFFTGREIAAAIRVCDKSVVNRLTTRGAVREMPFFVESSPQGRRSVGYCPPEDDEDDGDSGRHTTSGP